MGHYLAHVNRWVPQCILFGTPAMSRRLRILDNEEIKDLYERPRFTPEERHQFFSISADEQVAMEQLHSIKSRLYFLLQVGYFKARCQFFAFDFDTAIEDIVYLQERYFPGSEIGDIGKGTRLKQQHMILKLCNYRLCENEDRLLLQNRAKEAARISSKPIYILRELLHHLHEARIVAPSYSSMQDIVGWALTREQERLCSRINENLHKNEAVMIEQMLDDPSGLHEITQIKRQPKDFSLSQIKREIERGYQIAPLYSLAQRLLPDLGISNESIIYYASLVDYYTVYKLKRLDRSITYLYLLCFLFYRYQRLHDNLINSLIHNVKRYSDQAKDAAKERVYETRIEGSENLRQAAAVLKLFTDETIPASTPFGEVRAQAFSLLDRPRIEAAANHISKEARIDETAFQWDHVDTLVHQFKLNLRPLLLKLDLAAVSPNDPLLEAVCFLKTMFGQQKPLSSAKAFPGAFINESVRRYIYGKDGLLPDRYEFLVYRQLRNGLESGDIFCRDSVRFRSFEDDLLGEEQWQQKHVLIEQTGLSILNEPIEAHLAQLEEELEARICEVNRRIASEENDQIKVTKRSRRWKLTRLQGRESINHSVFDALRQTDIARVLHFVDHQTRFMDSFDHVLGRYVKEKSDEQVIVAALIAWGTNMGLGRMGQISDVGYQRLATYSDNFIRLETLRAANDAVSNATAALDLFRHYDIDAFHSSSDGQRFETRIHTFNARHSRKYFGLMKGVIVYSLVANHVPINAEIIGANEHESHYVFDLLYNNTTKMQPEVHSTDTHGTNEVNFALLHLFGYQFAPRYKDIYDRISTGLYGFKHPSHYEQLIKPIRKLNTRLIIEEWDNIKRIAVSLALKTTRQSIIVGKLSAHARKNKTKRALWEYDNLIRSLYLLDYVDSSVLRRNVEKALNRGENYHQLRRAVSYANFGKLRFHTEYEQKLWGECSRLITNCVIYYNAVILSHLWARDEGNGTSANRALLVSPVAWQHINFYGRYEFEKRPQPIRIEKLVQQLQGLPVADKPFM